jgi:hypothetical protein
MSWLVLLLLLLLLLLRCGSANADISQRKQNPSLRLL